MTYTSQDFRARLVIEANEHESSHVTLYDHNPRGLAVQVPPEWDEADIAFEASYNRQTWFPLRNSEGNLVIISGIQTSEAAIYAAPPEVWTIGTYPHIRIVSLDVSDGSPEDQTEVREVFLIFTQ